jgi:hypothetical protein
MYFPCSSIGFVKTPIMAVKLPQKSTNLYIFQF